MGARIPDDVHDTIVSALAYYADDLNEIHKEEEKWFDDDLRVALDGEYERAQEAIERAERWLATTSQEVNG